MGHSVQQVNWITGRVACELSLNALDAALPDVGLEGELETESESKVEVQVRAELRVRWAH